MDNLVAPLIPIRPEVQVAEQSPPPSRKYVLPIELWDQVVSMVESKRDLCQICRTNRVLQSVCERYIYREISIGPDNINKIISMKNLSRAMENYRLGKFVISFSVTLPTTISTGWDDPPLDECREWDQLIERVITPLPNLRELTYICSMFSCQLSGLHSYLQRLETTKLTRLTFVCLCLDNEPACFRILSAPCMQGVTYFCWHNMAYHEGEVASVEDDSYFPNLQELISWKIMPFRSHLLKGTIKSIRIDNRDTDLLDALSNCPSGLLHLYAADLESYLPKLTLNLTPYLKIKSMRGFHFGIIDNPDLIVTSLKALSCLPHLECIEMSILYFAWAGSFNPSHPYNQRRNPALVRDLNQELRGLCKVYIRRMGGSVAAGGFGCEVWELAGEWQSRDIEQNIYQEAVGLEGSVTNIFSN